MRRVISYNDLARTVDKPVAEGLDVLEEREGLDVLEEREGLDVLEGRDGLR